MSSMTQKLFRRKPVVEMEARPAARRARANCPAVSACSSCSMFGVGATIGTGIFFILSKAVPIAGPAVIWSFVIAGVVAGLTAVCYAELAGAVPVSGSSYSLRLRHHRRAAGDGRRRLPVAGVRRLRRGRRRRLVAVPEPVAGQPVRHRRSRSAVAGPRSRAGSFNLPAVILIALCALLLIRGASESATVNTVMVVIKIGVLIMFIGVGITGWNADNLADFAPFGMAGHQRRGRHHLLLLYRPGRRLHRRRGGEGPAAGPCRWASSSRC